MNLSKSVNFALTCALLIFLAKGVFSHFFASSNLVTASFNSVLLSPLATSNLKSVKVSLLNEISCLETPDVGPSIKTLLVLTSSTITANFPAKGP